MIVDDLDRAERYLGLHPLFPEAFRWLADPANQALPSGRHTLLGEDLFVLVDRGTTAAPAAKRFESHRRYIDIQVNVAGGERMGWTPVAGLVVEDDFAEGGDIAFYREPSAPSAAILVRPGQFCVFWPEDAHKPCLHAGDGPGSYHKLVAKVRR